MSAYVAVNWVFRLLPVVMAAVALYYYVRSRKYGDYGDESPSWWAERAEIENQEVHQISAESVNEKASKLGGTWERDLAHALNRQASEHTHWNRGRAPLLRPPARAHRDGFERGENANARRFEAQKEREIAVRRCAR